MNLRFRGQTYQSHQPAVTPKEIGTYEANFLGQSAWRRICRAPGAKMACKRTYRGVEY